jgi:hypothetical protein
LVYGRLLGVTLALLAISLVNTYHAWNRRRTVVSVAGALLSHRAREAHMATRAYDELDRAILTALWDGGARTSEWLRFLAISEARRLGKSAVDAERSLGRLHQRGCVSLAFGLERGSLTDLGALVARRLGRRPEGVRLTVEPGLRRFHARAC